MPSPPTTVKLLVMVDKAFKTAYDARRLAKTTTTDTLLYSFNFTAISFNSVEVGEAATGIFTGMQIPRSSDIICINRAPFIPYVSIE